MKPAIILPSLVTLSSAHGFVQQIWLGNNVVDTWNPYKDPFKKGLNKITRKFDNNGPVTDDLFETDAVTCNAAKFMWTEWKSDHPGPISHTSLAFMTYLPSCNGPCSSFSGSTDNVWVKIDQAGYDTTQTIPRASKRLPTQNSTYETTLPSTIAPGEYILRHEILGLQCMDTDGSLAQSDDRCLIFLEHRDVSASNPYTPPGGPVWGDKGWTV
ncbi:family 61 endoglucanase [Leptodontidium sp. MPI-SDFR-AT-0119]|nr:family 61 endoglucanase [Leptodontidium sp. MPI-SDFR-AT-0119]